MGIVSHSADFSARISDVLNFFVQMSSLLEIFVISCEKFEKLMALPELMENNGGRLPTDYRIRYEHVCFGYNAEKTILNDIDLDIKPNSLNAFCGHHRLW